MRLCLIGAALAALCLTTGCSATYKGTFCAIAKPIRLSSQTIDAMTDREVAAVLAMNERGQKLCGWHAGN